MKTIALLVAFASLAGPARLQAQEAERDGVPLLIQQLERAVQAADRDAYLGLLSKSADPRRAEDFVRTHLIPGATRVVIHERDRAPLEGTLPGNGYQVVAEMFAEYGARARVATWRIDVKRVGETADEWRVADIEQLASIETLYRLSLNPAKQYDAHDLTIRAEDLAITMAEGSVFVADTDQGATGLVLLGRGKMTFHPAPDTERGQVKLFAGSETLVTAFSAAYIRMNPSDVQQHLPADRLSPRAVDPHELRRADEVFKEESPKSFVLELGDLTRDNWSILPSPGDFLAEVRTRRFDTLTYARSAADAEDITVFDRRRHKNIALYPSQQKVASRGRFYNEDDLAEYDILEYDVDVSVQPERQWIDGVVKLTLRVKTAMLSTLSLKLADPLVVRSVTSTRFGRLLTLRVRNQNSIVVNLPSTVVKDTDIDLTIAYGGRVEPQAADRETLQVRGSRLQEEGPIVPPEPSYLYSSRTYWYPQGGVSDYATARIRLSVPATLDCVASGDLEPGAPVLVPAGQGDSTQPRKIYVFATAQPVRYLAFVISRFIRAETATIALADPPAPRPGDPPLTGVTYETLNLSVEANPRQAQRAHQLGERAVDVAQYYSSVVGDYPYPSFTVALIESDLPGGHSPGYFAALNQPLPTSPLQWRSDPAAFVNFPDFFIAHELAHQWWGQAVGWRNYHEQWLSEGFAQYFAALYARHERGDDVFAGVMRQMRRWAMDNSDQGPVYLGYRIGHIRSESRTFRAVVYNKSAAVLAMLHGLVGDEAFFNGVRRFYRTWRFKKAGTEDFRAAMEAEAHLPLDRFFERWIYGSTLPKIRLSYRVESGPSPEALLRIEQLGELFDFPVTVTLQYVNRAPVDLVIPVRDKVVERRVPLVAVLRSAEIRTDNGLLAEIVK